MHDFAHDFFVEGLAWLSILFRGFRTFPRLFVLLCFFLFVIVECDVCTGASTLGFTAVASGASAVPAALAALVVVWRAASVASRAVVPGWGAALIRPVTGLDASSEW